MSQTRQCPEKVSASKVHPIFVDFFLVLRVNTYVVHCFHLRNKFMYYVSFVYWSRKIQLFFFIYFFSFVREIAHAVYYYIIVLVGEPDYTVMCIYGKRERERVREIERNGERRP